MKRRAKALPGVDTRNQPMSKTNAGNYFEDFSLGQIVSRHAAHADGRRRGALHRTLWFALRGAIGRYFREGLGYPRAPLDDLLVFHTVFGKTVPDISLNAVANLGYAEGQFLKPVYPGATLSPCPK